MFKTRDGTNLIYTILFMTVKNEIIAKSAIDQRNAVVICYDKGT